jgi:hypothetical protein
MSLTQQDLDVTRRLLEQFHTNRPAAAAQMTDVEYIAFRMGGISRNRAQRLIYAARQNKTTTDVRSATRRAQRRR